MKNLFDKHDPAALSGTFTVTPEMLFQEIINLKTELANVTSLAIDCIFDLHEPQIFDDLYKADFETINAALKEDPRAMHNPEKLKDIPARTKKMFLLIQIAQRLTPPPPGSIQLVKPN